MISPGSQRMDGVLQQNRRLCHDREGPATRFTLVFIACPNGQRSRIPGKKLHLILCVCVVVCLCTQIGGDKMQKEYRHVALYENQFAWVVQSYLSAQKRDRTYIR